jgi:ubiquitin-conjugating enzyme E2 variant
MGRALPHHDEIGAAQRAVELGAIVAAGALLAWQAARLTIAVGARRPWLVLVAAAGVAAADFVSGLVHWAADTWGAETMPVLGRRLLRPFRVHHVNPHDFNRRDFIDTNGDVSILVLPALIAAARLSLEPTAGAAGATALVAFAASGWMTNQVHQWAHVPRPPRLVAWLQRHGLLLSRAAHARHHRAPHATHYCIATGWLNPLLDHLRVFRRLEWVVTQITGRPPRADDSSFAAMSR